MKKTITALLFISMCIFGKKGFTQNVTQAEIQTKFQADAINFEKSCTSNEAEACSKLGFLYLLGMGIKQDLPKAKELFEKSCTLNDGSGCEGIGAFYKEGIIVQQDLSKAKEYFKKSCDLNSEAGCDAYKKMNSKK